MRRADESALVQLTLLRIRELIREPEAMFWTFVFPVLLALGLGIAFRDSGPKPVRAAVVENDGRTAAELSTAGILVQVVGADSAAALLRRGEVAVVVDARAPTVVYRYDPDRPDSELARLKVGDALERAEGRVNVVSARNEPVIAAGSRYIDWLIPGLIGLNLLSTGLWGVGFTIVQMRKEQLMKRLMATPMNRAEFLASFFFGRLLFLFAELMVILAFGYFVFDVRVRGSLGALVFLAVLGAFTFTAFGLLVASRARTTEGVSGIMNAASFPMWVLSGVFFSYKTFPQIFQPFIRALPLTAFNDAARAVMNEALPLTAVWAPIAILAGWGVASFVLSLAVFRWR